MGAVPRVSQGVSRCPQNVPLSRPLWRGTSGQADFWADTPLLLMSQGYCFSGTPFLGVSRECPNGCPVFQGGLSQGTVWARASRSLRTIRLCLLCFDVLFDAVNCGLGYAGLLRNFANGHSIL
jgi:hypothetical protein